MVKALNVQINDKLYAMIKAYCDKHKISMREFIENVVYEYFEMEKDSEKEQIKNDLEQLFKIRIKIRRNKRYLKYIEKKIEQIENRITLFDLLEKISKEIEELEAITHDYYASLLGISEEQKAQLKEIKAKIILTINELSEMVEQVKPVLIKIKTK